MTLRNRGITGLVSTAAGLLVTACSTGDGMAGESTPTPESASGRGLVLTDVRVAGHDDFDRIVLEFSGSGTPRWNVDYADRAVLDGSGEAVALDGDAILDIYAYVTGWPAPDYYSGPTRLEPGDGSPVGDVYVGGTFEGSTQVLAGIDGGRIPFRVFTLAEPARLVVDVGSDID